MNALRPVLALSRHLRGQGRLFVLVGLVSWGALLLSVGTALCSIGAAAALAAGEAADAAATGLVLALAAGVLCLGLLHWLEQWFAHVLAYRVIDAIRLRVHRAISRLAPLGLARRRSGETVSAAMADAESLEWFYAHTAAQLLAGAGACAAVSAAAAVWLGPFALLVCAAQLLVISVPLLLLPWSAPQGRRLRGAVAELSARALLARTSARETLLLGRLPVVAAEMAEGTRRVQAARRAITLRTSLEQGLVEACTAALVLGALLLAVDAAARGELEVRQVPLAVSLAGLCLLPATAAAAALAKTGELAAAARRVDELIRAPGIRPQPPAGPAAPPREDPSRAGTVRLRGLRAGYPGVQRPVLDGLELDVAAGETLAITGASGAGKSTLGLVLARLVAPQAGRIEIDGVPAHEEDPERTRRRLVLVGQHAHVFRASVRENLLAPEAEDERLWAALEQARLADRVRALPAGLDEVLAERGASWSGGERQRLGLARGLLRGAGVLLLDEPTAGLDARTEAEFLAALREARRGRTTILITHRPAVMAACDRVAVLADGRIADSGPHERLLRESQDYRALLLSEGSSEDPPRVEASPLRADARQIEERR